jgi:hypothetical protein
LTKTLLIPFDQDGNQLGYDYEYRKKTELPNYEFIDTLTYKDCWRGRSAMTTRFTRASNGTAVQFFLTEFEKLIPYMKYGQVEGLFTFRKAGANFSCVLVRGYLD